MFLCTGIPCYSRYRLYSYIYVIHVCSANIGSVYWAPRRTNRQKPSPITVIITVVVIIMSHGVRVARTRARQRYCLFFQTKFLLHWSYVCFSPSADVYNVMVFSGRQCWQRNVTAAAIRRNRACTTTNRRAPTTRTTNRWTWSGAATGPTRPSPAAAAATATTITIITISNHTNPVSRVYTVSTVFFTTPPPPCFEIYAWDVTG